MEEHLRYADIDDKQQRSRLASLILQVPELVKFSGTWRR
jgi:hypothetical protein